MAATFGAATRAPFAAIVFVFELTRDYNAILPLMLATVLADLVARTLLPHSIMTEKLARRGVAVPAAFHADPLRSTPVKAVMMTARASPAKEGRDVNVATVEAGESLQAALRRMMDQGVDQLPVTDHGRLVGVCTRADVLAAQLRPLALEEREQGWLARRASRNGRARRASGRADPAGRAARRGGPPTAPRGRRRPGVTAGGGGGAGRRDRPSVRAARRRPPARPARRPNGAAAGAPRPCRRWSADQDREAPHRQQQLVLGGGEPSGPGRGLGEAEEAAQALTNTARAWYSRSDRVMARRADRRSTPAAPRCRRP